MKKFWRVSKGTGDGTPEEAYSFGCELDVRIRETTHFNLFGPKGDRLPSGAEAQEWVNKRDRLPWNVCGIIEIADARGAYTRSYLLFVEVRA